MKNAIYIIILLAVFSCKSKLYQIYEKQIDTKEEYILVNKFEVKNAMTYRNNLYYLGSDERFHYFKVYNTSFPAKFCLKFKINFKDLDLNEKKSFNENNFYKFNKDYIK